MLKFLREGAKRLGAATTPGAKKGGTKKGGGSKYYKRDKDTGQVKSLSEKKLTRRGAGVAAAGAATGAAGAAAASKGDKPKAKAKTSRRGPSMKEAGANIRKSKEAFERRRRSNRQAESAMRSVQKSRALGEAAARDPKATKPSKPEAPPTTSAKPPKADSVKVTSGATKPTPSKARTTPKVSSPPKVTKRPKVTGGGTSMESRNVTREGPMGKRTLANVTREQLVAAGLTTGPKGLKVYLDKFDELGRRPKPSDFKKTKEKASEKTTTRRIGSPASGVNRRPKPVKKMGGGMMKSKMASKGGARGGKKMPGGMKNGGMASKGGARGGKKFPDLTGDGRVTQADILKGRGVTKKRNGGMMQKKGFANGGAAMKKKGYSKGGAVRGKPRGVGAAKRGYGKAMR